MKKLNQNYRYIRQSVPSQNFPYTYSSNQNNDERFVGGFAFPFLLGGVTGAAIAPAFWNNGYGYNNRPGYYYPPAPYYPYQPRRWF